MSDVIGRGVIELDADASKLNASIAQARRSIAKLGDTNTEASKRASAAVDQYIKKITLQNQLHGKSTREAELFKLALKGATDEQLRAANAALKLAEAHKRGEEMTQRMRAGLLTLGTVAAASLIAAAVGFDRLIKGAGEYQDIAEKTGDTAQNMASLAVAAATAGVGMDAVASMSIKLSRNLTGVDDDSQAAGAAVKALGLNLAEFKRLKAADQIEAVAKALDQFEDSGAKAAVISDLFGKGAAENLPFFKELAKEGARQTILLQDQIEKSDDYGDAQAKMRAEITLHAQAIASQALPAMSELSKALGDVAKDQDIAAAASDTLRDAVKGGIIAFQTIAVLGLNLVYVFKAVGREIGALAAQYAALWKLDFKGFAAIGQAAREDAERERALLDKREARIMGVGEAKPPTDWNDRRNAASDDSEPKPRKTLNYKGTDANGKEKAKAQLAADLAKIRSAGEAQAAAYGNAEKIMEARRAANLISEREYYDAKRGLLNLGAQAEERALEAEIARLQKSSATGKDRIEVEQKITEAQAKLLKAREGAKTSAEVLTIQEEAAARRLAQSYLDAADAAANYIDTIKRQSEAELDGFGKGAKYRAELDERNRIEDRFLQERRKLDGELRRAEITPETYAIYLALARKTYQDEVTVFADRTARMNAIQADGMLGMSEALRNYADEAKNIYAMTEAGFTNALHGIEDAFVELATTGKASFKDLINSIHADLVRIGFRSMIGQAVDYLRGGAKDGSKKDGGAGVLDSIFGKSGANAPQAKAQADNIIALNAATTALANNAANLDIASTALSWLQAAADNAATALASVAASSSAGSGFESIMSLFAGASYDESGAMFSQTGDMIRGRRALGGPVSRNGLYRVNERGPELLTVAGEQYLMTHDSSGTITPRDNTSRGGDTFVTVQVTPPPNASRETANQFGAAAGRQIRHALRRNG